ncbi:MAG: AMP-binding protein, partial [Candidatus Aminicenantes bacterium]|nr:AMP-binding protein [Candidatus Aminicenantes bacterium]
MIPEEKKKILDEFNNTRTDYPQDKAIHALFEEQVERIPDRIAVLGRGPTRTNTDNNVPIYVTYKELNKISDCLAGLLIEIGVLADDIVGILMDPSPEMIVGILGILKAGAAYLPIDPAYPDERIDYMLKDSAAKIIVGNRHACSAGLNCQWLIVNCELLMSVPDAPFHHSSFIIHHSSHLAYIMYTS